MQEQKSMLNKIDALLTKINEIILMVFLFLMFAFTFANVVGRYFFSTTISWASEIARYMMMSMAFLGMGLAMRQSRHSAFYVFQNIFPDRIRKIIRTVVAALIFIVIVVLMVLGFQYMTLYMWNLTEVMRWPSGVWYATIPLGCFLFLFHFGMSAKDYINQEKDADLEAEITSGGELVEDSVFLQVATTLYDDDELDEGEANPK